MSEGRVKSAKVKVHQPPEGTGGVDGKFYVYVYDVFHKGFLPGKAFDNVERATQFQRHTQEQIYVEQEASPDLFDLPFLSADPDLIARIERDAEYRARLEKDLITEARGRARRR